MPGAEHLAGPVAGTLSGPHLIQEESVRASRCRKGGQAEQIPAASGAAGIRAGRGRIA